MQDAFTLFSRRRTELYNHLFQATSENEMLYRHGTPLLNSPHEQLNAGWILKKGLAREYRYDEHGDEVVTGFWSEGDIIIQQAAIYAEPLLLPHIDLISDARLVPFTLQSINIYFWNGSGPDFLKEMIVADKLRENLYKRILQLPAKKALYWLGKMYPLKYIPRKDLASFLGISPSTLFRLFPG